MKRNLSLIAIITLVGGLCSAYAQQQYYDWRIGAGAGVTYYHGDLSNGFNRNAFSGPAYQVMVGRLISPSFGLELNGTWAALTGNDRTTNWRGDLQFGNPNFSRGLNFRTTVRSAGLILQYRFNNGIILSKYARFAPYVFAGAGITDFKVYSDLQGPDGQPYYFWPDNTIRNQPVGSPDAQVVTQDGKFETRVSGTERGANYATQIATIPFGAGVQMRLADRLSANLRAEARYAFTDYLDNVSGGGRDMYFMGILSLQYHFNKGQKAFRAPVVYVGYEQPSADRMANNANGQTEPQVAEPATRPGSALDDVSRIPAYRKQDVTRLRTEPEVSAPSALPARRDAYRDLSGNTRQRVDLKELEEEQYVSQFSLPRIYDENDYVYDRSRSAYDPNRPAFDRNSPLYDRNASLENRNRSSYDSNRSAFDRDSPLYDRNASFDNRTRDNSTRSSYDRPGAYTTLDRQRAELRRRQEQNEGAIRHTEEELERLRVQLQEAETRATTTPGGREADETQRVRTDEELRYTALNNRTRSLTTDLDRLRRENEAYRRQMSRMNRETVATDLSLLNRDLNANRGQTRNNQASREVNAKLDSLTNLVNQLNARLAAEGSTVADRTVTDRNGTDGNGTDGNVTDRNVTDGNGTDRTAPDRNVTDRTAADRTVNDRTAADRRDATVDASGNTIRQEALYPDSPANAYAAPDSSDLAQQLMAGLERLDDEVVDSLQNQIAELRQTVESLENQMVARENAEAKEAPAAGRSRVKAPYGTLVVYYPLNVAVIGEADKRRLNTLAERLKSNPNALLQVSGYTDNTGNADYNLALSRQRAENLRDYLVAQSGIAADRVLINYYGQRQASGQGKSPYDRRVEAELYVVEP